MSYNLLKGKRGIIFGALNEQSIAWKVAEKAVEEGATITLSNTPVAVRMGEVSALAEKLNCEVIAADATSVEDLENVFKRSMEVLGGQVDFVLHAPRPERLFLREWHTVISAGHVPPVPHLSQQRSLQRRDAGR